MGRLTSECCGSNAWFSLGAVHGIYKASDTYIGVCSNCKEHAIFHDTTVEETSNVKPSN